MSFLRSNYQFVEDTTLRGTTSTLNWLTAATMTTPALPLGDYRIEFTAEFSLSSPGRTIQFQVLSNGVVIEDVEDTTATITNKFMEWGSYLTRNDIQGVQTLELRFRVGSSGSTTATVRNATLEIFRTNS